MASNPQRGDLARMQRNQLERMRLVWTSRPKDTNVPSLGWHCYGQVTLAWEFLPQPIGLDAGENDEPEHKQIVAIDGYLKTEGVDVVVDWAHNTGTFYNGHVITAGEQGAANRTVFDGLSGRPEPFIIQNGDRGGEWAKPVIAEEPELPAFLLACVVFVETVPV